MNNKLLNASFLSLTCFSFMTCHEALSQSLPPDKASKVPSQFTSTQFIEPIYPPQDQQIGQIWNTTEILRCPDGTSLSFEDHSPLCVALSLQPGGQ